MDHPGRIAAVQSKLDDLGVDALIATNLTNVRYLTGFSGSAGAVLIAPDEAFFFSDRRYEQRASALVKDATIEIYKVRLADVLAPRLESLAATRLGYETATMTVHDRDELASRLEGVELVGTKGAVEDLRRVKEPAEVERIRSAVALSDEAFSWVLDTLSPGQSERDLALELEMHMRGEGADDVSFEPIVGSGPLTAHIHHTPSDRRFGKGDLVLMDFGARVDGYCSDLTRTVVLGAATDDQLEMYELVLNAQSAAVATIRAAAHGRDVDGTARKLLTDAGKGDFFGHGLGHGVGLDIHEDPYLSPTSEDTLRAGDVITVEPGVYLPGTGGVRIEDCVLVTDTGAEVLGSAVKDTLIEL
jgi:Xaa-Pro aminopeptidase